MLDVPIRSCPASNGSDSMYELADVSIIRLFLGGALDPVPPDEIGKMPYS